jgi:hypothetical protein
MKKIRGQKSRVRVPLNKCIQHFSELDCPIEENPILERNISANYISIGYKNKYSCCFKKAFRNTELNRKNFCVMWQNFTKFNETKF